MHAQVSSSPCSSDSLWGLKGQRGPDVRKFVPPSLICTSGSVSHVDRLGDVRGAVVVKLPPRARTDARPLPCSSDQDPKGTALLMTRAAQFTKTASCFVSLRHQPGCPQSIHQRALQRLPPHRSLRLHFSGTPLPARFLAVPGRRGTVTDLDLLHARYLNKNSHGAGARWSLNGQCVVIVDREQFASDAAIVGMIGRNVRFPSLV